MVVLLIVEVPYALATRRRRAAERDAMLTLALGAEAGRSFSTDLVDAPLQRARFVVDDTMRDARSDTAVLLHTMRAPSSCPPGGAPGCRSPLGFFCLVARHVVESPPTPPSRPTSHEAQPGS